MLAVADLITFEEEIAELFSQGKIKSPVHLRGGNEKHLIEIFKEVSCYDHCFFTWASHLECLLKGVPREEVKAAILRNKSICLSFKEYNIISSAIVGGNAPLAVGKALALKRLGSSSHVWCFMGDMSFYTGSAQESIRYSQAHKLPITFVIANNGVSVNTPTREMWGRGILFDVTKNENCRYYSYKNSYNHAGIGGKVVF